MSYAFSYDCWDKPTTDEATDEYSRSRQNSLDVVVVSNTADEALAKVKELVVRDIYKLTDIAELTELHSAGR